MNILVDGRIWSLYSAGIGTFFTSAMIEWAEQSDKDTFYVLLPKGLDDRYELPQLPDNIKLLDYAKRFPRRLPNIIILQLLVPHLCRKLAIDLYYSPVPHLPYCIPSKVRTMVTVHDVVNIELAHTMSWTNRMATSFFFAQAIKKADFIWANSHYTKSKVNEYFPQRRAHDIFVGGAVDRKMFYPRLLTEQARKDIKAKYGINDKFILFVGSLEPRKNLKFLLSIIPELYQRHGIQLVVVGGKSWKSTDIRDIVEAPEFPKASTIFCGFVTNEELAMLYCCADCFVSAALMEGLGMPQIEALLCGCPVVTAHNTAMIEVAHGKDGAVTVKGYEPQDWIQTILNMIKEPKTVNPQQLAEYDWTTIIRRLRHMICTIALLFTTLNIQAEIPIVAYYGIPLEYSNVSRFKEFKEAGFDVSICFYEDTPVDTLLRILDDAQKSGIQLLISSGWVSVQPHVGIPRLKHHPALYGYFLQDEPWPKDIQETTRRYRAMAKQDTGKPTYVNLLPDYGDGMPKEFNMPPYKQYLQAASTIGQPFISFDFYPIMKTGIRPTWYSCLEDVRQESLRTGKPFWAFALCTPHCVYPQPTIESLRLQIYSDLAYGAQAVEYFTYWTPKPTKAWDFHDAPISIDGRRTKTYDVVRRMNQELRGLLPLFDKAEVQTVNHMLKIPEGTTKLQRVPTNIKKLKVVGRQGALISTFKKDGHLFMAVVNKDYQSDMTLYISAKNNVTMLTKQLKETAIKSSYKIGGGDMLLFKLK
jgi:glycosyltransferase involved in cell wall biosynthesis